jgi:molybdopterin converting factor small subunit
MAAEVRLAAALRKFTGGAISLLGQGETVGRVLDNLEGRCPGLKRQLITDGNKLHPFINIYLNDEDIRFLKELETPVTNGDVIIILLAMAGGRVATSKGRG